MMNFRIKKLVQAEIFAAFYLLMRAFTWYHGFLEHKLIYGYTEEEALNSALSEGYFGGEELGLIMPIVVILLTEYLTDKEESVFMIRFSGREKYLRYRCRWLLIAVFIYNVLYIMVGLGYLGMQFSFGLMTSKRLLNFAFSHFLVLFLYAARTCILYMILRDMVNQKFLAMGIVILLYLTAFYLVMDQWLYPVFKRPVTVSSFADITAAGMVYIGAVSQVVCRRAAFRQLIMLVLAMLLWSVLWKKKDVIRFER